MIRRVSILLSIAFPVFATVQPLQYVWVPSCSSSFNAVSKIQNTLVTVLTNMVGYMISILSLIFSLTSVNTPRFLKNVWPFFNIKNEDIKSIYVLKQICFRIQSIYGNILSRKTRVLFSDYIAYQKHPSEVFRKKRCS